MNLSTSNASSINSNFKVDNNLYFLKQKSSSTKVNVPLPKNHRNALSSSNLNLLSLLENPSSQSCSNQHHSSLSSFKVNTPNKLYNNTKNFSKNKESHYLGSTKNVNSSFSLSGINSNNENINSNNISKNNNSNNLNISYQYKSANNYNNLSNSYFQKDSNSSYDQQSNRFSNYTDILQSPMPSISQHGSSDYITLTQPSLYNPHSSGVLGDIATSSYGLKQSVCYFDVQKKIRQLQNKVQKNEQHLKLYYGQVEYLKNQISSSSRTTITENTESATSINMLPSKQYIEPLKIPTQPQIDKQNNSQINSTSNNIFQQFQKRTLKHIQSLKKQIKKIINQQQTIKGDMKMFQLSIKQVLTGYKEYISRSTQQLNKKQQKNKKKIIQKINQWSQKKIKQFLNKEINQGTIFQRLKLIQKDIKDKIDNHNIRKMQKIIKSKQKFIKDPILIKIKQEVYGLGKNNIGITKNKQQTYQQMIKRNIYNSLGKSHSQLSSQISPFNTINCSKSMDSYSFNNIKNQQLPAKSNIQNILLQSSQTTYYIDQQGYILDSEGYYLLLVNNQNNKQQKIKLNSQQMIKLRQQGMLD